MSEHDPISPLGQTFKDMPEAQSLFRLLRTRDQVELLQKVGSARNALGVLYGVYRDHAANPHGLLVHQHPALGEDVFMRAFMMHEWNTREHLVALAHMLRRANFERDDVQNAIHAMLERVTITQERQRPEPLTPQQKSEIHAKLSAALAEVYRTE